MPALTTSSFMRPDAGSTSRRRGQGSRCATRRRSCWSRNPEDLMYGPYYGFREAPFELTANPKYLFFTAQHREALSNLEYGLSFAKPITVLIGEAGTGKSTLLRAALASDQCRHVKCVFLDNPTLTRDEFVQILASRFELGGTAERSKATLLGALESV